MNEMQDETVSKRKNLKEENLQRVAMQTKIDDITDNFPALDQEKIDVKHLFGNNFRVNYWTQTDTGRLGDNLIHRSIWVRSITTKVAKGSITTSIIVPEQESMDSIKENPGR